MKTIKFLILGLVVGFFGNAQVCESMSYFKEGLVTKTKMLDDKDKVTGYVKSTVKEVKSSGDKTTATLSLEHFDKKDKPNENMQGMEAKYSCENNVIKVDLSKMMPAAFSSMAGGEVKIEGDDLSYPATLSTGQTLRDAKITMDLAIATGVPGFSGGKFTYEVKNRKVVAKEKLTTEAGTFDVYKITYDYFSDMQMGPVPIKSSGRYVEWFNHENGSLQNEMYDAKDKRVSKSVVVEISK